MVDQSSAGGADSVRERMRATQLGIITRLVEEYNRDDLTEELRFYMFAYTWDVLTILEDQFPELELPPKKRGFLGRGKD